MSEIQYIVSRLNEEPFNVNLGLLDFDEIPPLDLLQHLNDILSGMNSDMKADVRKENEESRAFRITKFLHLLKYKDIPQMEEDRDKWMHDLGTGQKTVIYPLLHWILSTYDSLCRRAYLGRFLVPFELPTEFTVHSNPVLIGLMNSYKELQGEFKLAHKEYERVKGKSTRPSSELAKEIRQLEEERRQVKDRIEILASKTKNFSGFDKMLQMTRKIREEQDREICLQDRMKEQKRQLYLAEKKYSEIKGRLESSESSGSTDAILNELERELKESTRIIYTKNAVEKRELQEQIDQLMRERVQPKKTEEDLERVRNEVIELEDECKELQQNLDEENALKKSDKKLSMYVKHANLAAATLRQKEEEVKSKEKELQILILNIEELQSTIEGVSEAQDNIIHIDGNSITKTEILSFLDQHQQKLDARDKTSKHLAKLRAESIVLQNTEKILKSKSHNLDEFLNKEEAKAGVLGCRQANEMLAVTNEKFSAADDEKVQSLEEISVMVQNITRKLEDKKVSLKPQIEDLKKSRKQFEELQSRHRDKKHQYDKVAFQLTNNRNALEKECEKLHEEWLDYDRNFHFLSAVNEIVRCNLSKVEMEERWSSKKERFLPDFKNLEDLYGHKFDQQEKLAKELRKKQRSIKENEDDWMFQRALFVDLEKLLKFKVEVVSKQSFEEDENCAKEAMLAETVDIGDAQVLCME